MRGAVSACCLAWQADHAHNRGARVVTFVSLCVSQVGLALALIVRQDAHIDHDYGQKLLFHTSGIAFLTLAVNGTSMRLVLGWLGYLKCVARHPRAGFNPTP